MKILYRKNAHVRVRAQILSSRAPPFENFACACVRVRSLLKISRAHACVFAHAHVRFGTMVKNYRFFVDPPKLVQIVDFSNGEIYFITSFYTLSRQNSLKLKLAVVKFS